MKYGKMEMLVGALRRPDLALRYLSGRMPSEFELDEVSSFVDSPSPNIVEAGAFDGRDTLRFSTLWPTGTIYAFEPLPTLADRVRLITDGRANVIVIEAALAVDDSNTADLYTFDENDEVHGSSSILKPGDHLKVAPEIKFQRRVTVRAVTLDDWHQSIGSPRIDLMWLDLQGAELKVLEKGATALRETEVIHIEVSRRPLYEGGTTFRELTAFLKEHGFNLKKARIPVRSGNAIYIRSHQ